MVLSAKDCCLLCVKMEELYLGRPAYDYDEEMENCEIALDEQEEA